MSWHWSARIHHIYRGLILADVTGLSGEDLAALHARVDDVMIRDVARLRRRVATLREQATPEKVAHIVQQIEVAEAVVAARAAAVPVVSYPDLPVSAHRDRLIQAITHHQVVVVAGETGSGKTTQLPKICVEMGRGVRGVIGHTQPRRLAARTVAQRIAEELGAPLTRRAGAQRRGEDTRRAGAQRRGEDTRRAGAQRRQLVRPVGYTVRFDDHAGDDTLIRVMTDGIVLAEIQRDPQLLRYDTLIIDEAHERSLNIDFLLGYLKQLLVRRPDLTVIVTSATIEQQRFAAHFDSAPIIEVSGRTYPVEIRYRPWEIPVANAISDDAGNPDDADDPDDPDHEVVRTQVRDQIEAIVAALDELTTQPPGDVLVFLSGEREIRDTAEVLRKQPNYEVLPLYARLSAAEQQRVFQPSETASRLHRRVILATNIAETSLTIPGIRYVVDPGWARISRYSRRTKVQRLPIERISQASAAQRAGRSGRVAPGVCIRLYSEQDFQTRPRYTEPEILRTNLAAVVLQMAAAQLGDIAHFPFMDPPDQRSIRDGVQLLVELGACDAAGDITAVGRRLARLPVDPRIGRMILQADEQGCVREVLVVAAALSIPDPRECPVDCEEAARSKHARFADKHSDFISYLNLWRYLSEQRKGLSGSAFRKMCRDDFLHYMRIRQWQDLVEQLRSIAAGLGIRESGDAAPADSEHVHAALVAGLLSHIGLRDDQRCGYSREYAGARNTKFILAPGSVLTRRPPRWIVVADLIETSRVFGRVAARINPEVVERVGEHLITRTYSEPHWNERRGAAMVYERVGLYGLPLVPRRLVGYSGVDPAAARELFLQHALVAGQWQTHHRFFIENSELRSELAQLEERARRRDLLVGDEVIYAFYDARIPADVVSVRHFDSWWKKQRRHTPDMLTLTRDELLCVDDDVQQPDTWDCDGASLPLSYRFDPSAADDGVTVHIPIDVLDRLSGADFSWQVPALREELVVALLRSLPKNVRRSCVPIPDTARAMLEHMEPGSGSVVEALRRELRRRKGVEVPCYAFDLTTLPAHMRMTFAVQGSDGAELAQGKDLDVLRDELAQHTGYAVADVFAQSVQRRGLHSWPADVVELPRSVEHEVHGRQVRGYPGFADTGSAVDVQVFASARSRDTLMTAGIRRLVRLSVPSPVAALAKSVDQRTRLIGAAAPQGSLSALLDDCADAAVDVIAAQVWTRTDAVWTKTEFTTLCDQVMAQLGPLTADIFAKASHVVEVAQQVRVALSAVSDSGHAGGGYADAVADMGGQLDVLLPPRFVTASGAGRLADVARYLTAMIRRLDRLGSAGDADRDRMQRVQAVTAAYADLIRACSSERAAAADITDIAWMIQEFRVSLWAQQLGTARPVSEQRIYRSIAACHPGES